MKYIKGIWDKINEILDGFATQLGLQHRPIPVRIKKNKVVERQK